MLITNGTIEFKTKTGGGMDPETGFPVKPSESWSVPIPCQFRINKYNNKGRSNGEAFVIASYEILVEDDASLDSERLRLVDQDGENLGEYSVISIEPLSSVCQIRIMV